MKKMLASLLALAPVLTLAAPTTWTIDPSHSHVGFSVKHLVVSTVRGEFGTYSGRIQLDEQDLAKSSVEATVDVSSIDTKVADRDAHLRSPDFFDAATHPAMTFRSTRVEETGKGKLKVLGDLTLRGVTRPVTLDVVMSPDVKGMSGETRRAFSGTTKISRKDFGLAWNKLVEAGPAVGDEVAIALDLEVVKDPPTTASN